MGGPVNIQAVSSPGDTGESIFQVRHGESLKKVLSLWMVGIEPTTPNKTLVLPTTPFINVSGVLVRTV